MKKIIFILFIIIISIFVISNEKIYAFSLGGQLFHGKISNLKATEIESLESSGWICTVPGSTIQIREKGYFISSTTRPETKHQPKIIQSIIGKWSGMENINCEYCTPAGCTTTTVSLPRITLFGTSKI